MLKATIMMAYGLTTTHEYVLISFQLGKCSLNFSFSYNHFLFIFTHIFEGKVAVSVWKNQKKGTIK